MKGAERCTPKPGQRPRASRPPAAEGSGRDSPHSMKSSTQARVATITSKVSPMLCHMSPTAHRSPRRRRRQRGPLLEAASPPR